MQTMHTCGIKDGAFILPFYPTQVELTGVNWLTQVELTFKIKPLTSRPEFCSIVSFLNPQNFHCWTLPSSSLVVSGVLESADWV